MRKFRVFERSEFYWEKYPIVDDNGHEAAHIICRDYPDNASLAVWGTVGLPRTTPTVLVDWKTGRMLNSLVADHVDVFLKFSTSFDPLAYSYNIVGSNSISKRASKRDTVLVLAHYDTQYNTSGAVDNATGVACLLALAKRHDIFAKEYHLQFIATGAEEVGLAGARDYLATLKEKGELSRIACVLNLDMLGCNEPNWIHVSDNEDIVEVLKEAYAVLGLDKKYQSLEFVNPPWPTADHDPFYDEGIPVICFTWKGSLYKHIHTPEDSIDKVDWSVLNDSYELAERTLTLLTHKS